MGISAQGRIPRQCEDEPLMEKGDLIEERCSPRFGVSRKPSTFLPLSGVLHFYSGGVAH